MCQAIPRRVLDKDGDRLLVDYDERPTWVHAVGATATSFASDFSTDAKA